MDNDVEEFLTTGKFSKKESVKARNELLDCIRSCLDVMQDSLDWNYLKTYYNNDRLDSKDEYDETVDVDTGSSLGDPIDWEFESIDPKVGEIEMPDDLTKIVFGQVDILTLKVTRGCTYFAPWAFPQELLEDPPLILLNRKEFVDPNISRLLLNGM